MEFVWLGAVQGGVMYALGSCGVVLGLRGSMLGLCVAGVALGALCLELAGEAALGWYWRRAGLRLVAIFAWQARHFRLSKGSDARSGVVWG